MVSALSVYLCSKLLDPLVFYAYWNAICWPVDGLMIGVLLLCSRRDWPWIMLGYVVASVPFQIRDHMAAPLILIDTVCNLGEVGLAAYWLPACRGLPEWLRRPRLILRFSLLAVIGAPLLAAIVWAIFTYFYLHWEFWIVLRRWLSGDALGIALFTPLVLVVFSSDSYKLFQSRQRNATLCLFGVLVGICWFAFHINGYPIAFLTFPALIIVVNRIGFPGAVLAVNVLTIIATTSTIKGNGPFMLVQGIHEPYRIMALQAYLTLSMVTGFAITLTALERDDFQEQLKLALQQMEVLATHDALTSLGNRRLFDQTLDVEWSRAKREGRSIGLLLLDADHFKSYNDTYGHVAGDECLSAIAASIAPQMKRAGDLAARYGGEEFVVLLPGASLEHVRQVAESIRQGVELLDIPHLGNAGCRVTVSVGCSAMIPDEDAASQRLVESADEALYAAKQGGRNSVVSRESWPVLASLALAPAG